MKVSVLIPVYNTKEEYLRLSIESILNQTYKNYELLILNDCSSDENIEKVIKSYKDKRIKYYTNEKNLGISLTRNKLIDLAKGEYLAIMDHDDISLPKRFEKQVEFLDNNTEYGVVGSWNGIINTKKIKKLPVENDEIEKTLFIKCCICHPSTMIRKSIFLDNNIRYNKYYSPSEDYAIWAEFLGKTKFYNIPEVLFMYRNYKDNTSNKQKDRMHKAGLKIKNLIRNNNPNIWNSIQDTIIDVSKIKLFGLLNIMTVETNLDKTNYSLFGFIPLFSCKRKKVKK